MPPEPNAAAQSMSPQGDSDPNSASDEPKGPDASGNDAGKKSSDGLPAGVKKEIFDLRQGRRENREEIDSLRRQIEDLQTAKTAPTPQPDPVQQPPAVDVGTAVAQELAKFKKELQEENVAAGKEASRLQGVDKAMNAKHKVLFYESIHPEGAGLLEEKCEVIHAESFEEEWLLDRADDLDGILIRANGTVSRRLIESAARLRMPIRVIIILGLYILH